MSELLITSFLKRAELKDELFIALRLVSEVGFKLDNTPFLLILPFGEVIDFTLVQVSQVLLHMRKFLRLTVLEFIHLTAILCLKLRFNVIISRQDSIHVLFGLFLGI